MRDRWVLTATLLASFIAGGVRAETGISRAVQPAGKPVSGSSVTLYAAGSGAPVEVAEARTGAQGAFRLTGGNPPAGTGSSHSIDMRCS